MKKDISNESIVDLDLFLKLKKEPIEIETKIDTTPYFDTTPYRKVLEEVCYKLPKGFPTIKDGKFVDRDEVIVINEALEQAGLQTIELPEAKAKTTNFNTPPAGFSKWWNSLDATKRTNWFELLPIIQSLRGNEVPVTVKEILTTIRNNGSLDWGDVDYILKYLLTADKESKDWLNNYYLAGKTQDSPITQNIGMTSIYANKPINSFLWATINTTFYNWVKAIDKTQNKEFTADVILFWGVKDPMAIEDKIKAAIADPKTLKGYPSIIILDSKQKVYMACVSLKAGHGRLGKLTQYTNNFLPPEMREQSLQEGLLDLLKSAGKTLSNWWNKIKNYFVGVAEKVEKTFSNTSREVSVANDVSQDLVEFEQLISEAESGINGLSEVSDVDGIVCDVCMKEKIQDMNKKFLPTFLKGTALKDFDKLMKTFATESSFRYAFTSMSNKDKEVQSASKSVQVVVDQILQAKPVKKPVLNKKGMSPIKCQPLQLKPIPRKDLKNILFISANQNAIITVTNLLQSAFPKGPPKKKAMVAFLQVAVNLNAQSVFGKSGNLPLVKFTGNGAPIQLGTKSDYIAKSTANMANFTKDISRLSLPIIGLRITPSSGKSGENPYYYGMTLYTLYDINLPEGGGLIGLKDFKYAVISLKCNSGSGFSYVVEGEGVADGATLLKALK